MEQYGVAFGDMHVSQISPLAIDLHEVYLDENGKMNLVMDNVVDGILKVLLTISKTVGTKDFHHMTIKKLINSCINDWHRMSHNKLDLGTFCLMLIIQICCLAKVGINEHRDLNNLVYPMSSLGVAKQLSDVNPSDQPYTLSLILRECDLNCMERTLLTQESCARCQRSGWGRFTTTSSQADAILHWKQE
jgi:hypothetical protein